MSSYIEHANVSVTDAKHTVDFLLTAIPEWSVRGQGEYHEDNNPYVSWFHVGDDNSYIAVQSNGDGLADDWQNNWTGVKHIGIVVADVEAMITRLKNAGYEMDHRGGEHPHRKSVYYVDKHNVQFEFVEYFSDKPEERNDYLL